jgi:hypothetical protein
LINERAQAGGKPTSFGSAAQALTTAPPVHIEKKHNFKLIKYFLPYFTDCLIFRANKDKVTENALPHMLLKLIIDRV